MQLTEEFFLPLLLVVGKVDERPPSWIVVAHMHAQKQISRFEFNRHVVCDVTIALKVYSEIQLQFFGMNSNKV